VSEQDIESYLLDYVEDNYFMQLEDESEKDVLYCGIPMSSIFYSSTLQIAKYIHQLFESLSKNDDSILIQIREYAEKMGKQAQTIVSKASKGTSANYKFSLTSKLYRSKGIQR
jgi:hypothetical protein